MKFATIITFILFLTNHVVVADKVTSAFKQLEKENYEKVKSLLDKELEKDSISAGALHVYSLYFFVQKNPSFNLDSAYFYIQSAIKNYEFVESKDSSNWATEGISFTSAEEQKKKIEVSAFERAKKENTINSFQFFLDNFLEAEDIPNAIRLRNELAWQVTLKNNSIESYNIFLQTYPKATQKTKAIARRDKLIYNRETKGNTLNTYQNFLKKYPSNIYKKDGENALFDFLNVEHTEQTYLDFLQKYPNCEKAKTAWAWLQTFYLEREDLNSFTQKFSKNPNNQTLKKLAKVGDLQYIPFYENELYGYFDEEGKKAIQAKYNYIPHEQLCESNREYYMTININNRLGMIDKLGNILIKPEFDEIEKIATGVWKVSRNARYGLVHETGFEILPLQYDNIEVLNAFFIKTEKNRRYGLVTYNGRNVLDNQYSDVFAYNENFVGIRLGKKFGIFSNEKLIEQLHKNRVEVELIYNDATPLSNTYLKTQKDKKFGLRNLEGQYLDCKYQSIKFEEQIGYATQDSFWQLFNFSKQLVLDSLQDIHFQNEKYILAKKADKWALFDKNARELEPFAYDSLALVGDILLMYQGKKVEAKFLKNLAKEKLNLTYYKNIKGEKGNYPDAKVFLHIENRFGKKGLYSEFGTQVLATKYDNFYILSENLINIKVAGKFGLVDTTGKIIIKPLYAGLTQNKDSTITTLLRGKFGLYDLKAKKQISSIYETSLQAYFPHDSSTYYIAQKKEKKGLIDLQGKTKIPFNFQEIRFWSDTIALVQNTKDKYFFYNMKTKTLNDTLVFDEVAFSKKTGQTKLMIVQKDSKYGVWSNTLGEILPMEYDLIYNVGTPDKHIFFAQKVSEDGENHEVLYMTEHKKIVWKTTMSELDYHRLLCE